MKFKTLALIIIGSIAATTSYKANSALITYSYSGTTDLSSIGGSAQLEVTASFTIDTNLPTEASWACFNDICNSHDTSFSWVISIDGLPSISPEENTSFVEIQNNLTSDTFTAQTDISPTTVIPGYEIIGVSFRATDFDGVMFNDFSIPSSSNAFTEADALQSILLIQQSGDSIVTRAYAGLAPSITITSVPLPPSIILFLSGLLGIVLINIKQHNNTLKSDAKSSAL